MKADLSQIQLTSASFAGLIEEDCEISGLKDGTVYVRTAVNDSMTKEIENLHKHMITTRTRALWLMQYDVEIMPDDLDVNIDGNYPFIMPVTTLDRSEKIYLAGTLKSAGNLETAISFLTIDAQKISEACIPMALANVEDKAIKRFMMKSTHKMPGSSWAEIVAEIAARFMSPVVFQASRSASPLSTLGKTAAKAAKEFKDRYDYKKGRETIFKLHSIGEGLRNSDQAVKDKALEDFGIAYESLSESERIIIFSQLIELLGAKEIIYNNADRDKLGRKTKCSITVCKWEPSFKRRYDFDDNYKFCPFLISPQGEDIPLNMQPRSTVMYIMSLIEKCTSNKEYAIVDIKSNEKAFMEVYKFMFNDYNEDDTKARFDDLFIRKRGDSDKYIRAGRLSDAYKNIENVLDKAFENLDEYTSPFIANASFPLAIPKEKINLPQEILKIRIK